MSTKTPLTTYTVTITRTTELVVRNAAYSAEEAERNVIEDVRLSEPMSNQRFRQVGPDRVSTQPAATPGKL